MIRPVLYRASPICNGHGQDDKVVLWLYSTITRSLLDIFAQAGCTAYTIWTQLHEYLLEKEAELTMHPGLEFQAVVHGDQSINDSCRRLQGIAATLADVRGL